MHGREKGGYHSRYRHDKYGHNYHHVDNYRDKSHHPRSDHSSSHYKDDLIESRESHSRYSKSYRNERRHSPYSRYHDSESDGEDGKTIAEISGLDKSITERDIESLIRHLAIRNGFSPPNSVSIFPSDDKTINFSIENKSIIQTNKAHIEFPSSVAINRFLKSLKIPKIQINGNYYSVIKLDLIPRKNSDEFVIGQTSSKGTIQVMNSMVKMFCDWNCPSCNYFNFSKRLACLQCNAPRPEEFQQQSLSQLTNISNLTNEYSPWIVVKDIPNSLTFNNIIHLLNDKIPDLTGLERIYYFSDKSNRNFGFSFIVFNEKDNFSSYFKMEGNNYTSQSFNSIPLRIDWMLLKEQIVASDLINRIKFDIVHKHQITSNEVDKKYAKIYSTTIEVLDNLLKSNDMNVRFSGYLGNWMGKTIWFPNGDTESDKWPTDKSTNYKFNKHLNLYYDPNSRYYMLSSGGYFIWDNNCSSLIRVEIGGTIEENYNDSNIEMPIKNEVPDSIKVLQEARRMAKASQPFKVSGTTSIDNISMQFRVESEKNIIKVANKMPIKISTSFTNRVKNQESEISENLICFTCLRYFENQDRLVRHEQLSEYHKSIASQI